MTDEFATALCFTIAYVAAVIAILVYSIMDVIHERKKIITDEIKEKP